MRCRELLLLGTSSVRRSHLAVSRWSRTCRPGPAPQSLRSRLIIDGPPAPRARARVADVTNSRRIRASSAERKREHGAPSVGRDAPRVTYIASQNRRYLPTRYANTATVPHVVPPTQHDRLRDDSVGNDTAAIHRVM